MIEFHDNTDNILYGGTTGTIVIYLYTVSPTSTGWNPNSIYYITYMILFMRRFSSWFKKEENSRWHNRVIHSRQNFFQNFLEKIILTIHIFYLTTLQYLKLLFQYFFILFNYKFIFYYVYLFLNSSYTVLDFLNIIFLYHCPPLINLDIISSEIRIYSCCNQYYYFILLSY